MACCLSIHGSMLSRILDWIAVLCVAFSLHVSLSPSNLPVIHFSSIPVFRCPNFPGIVVVSHISPPSLASLCVVVAGALHCMFNQSFNIAEEMNCVDQSASQLSVYSADSRSPIPVMRLRGSSMKCSICMFASRRSFMDQVGRQARTSGKKKARAFIV